MPITSPNSIVTDSQHSYFQPPHEQPRPQTIYPDSPPHTPIHHSEKSKPTMSLSSQLEINTGASGAHRHPYQNSNMSNPPSPGSPVPTLAADSGAPSPAGSSAVITPATIISNSTGIRATPSEHTALKSLTLSTPPLSGDVKAFPLLPPHHPLRKNLYSQGEKDGPSSPTTPKGHPLSSTASAFPFGSKTKYGIVNPYSKTNGQSYTSSLAYLLRVPRRLRPALIIAFSLFIFGLVFLSRAMSEANRMDTLVRQRTASTGPFGRRFLEVDGQNLVDINYKQVALQNEHNEGARIAHSAIQQTAEPIEFANKEEELLALISFITAATGNSLPPLDPEASIDPSILLGFDPAAESAADDLQLLKDEVNALYPLVLFGRMRDPWHREVQKLIATYKITPAPLIVDVDQRRDHALFIPVLSRLLDSTELPQLILLGKSVGNYHSIMELSEAGKFRSFLESSDALSVRDAKPPKKGRKEKERLENERVLGPKPIIE